MMKKIIRLACLLLLVLLAVHTQAQDQGEPKDVTQLNDADDQKIKNKMRDLKKKVRNKKGGNLSEKLKQNVLDKAGKEAAAKARKMAQEGPAFMKENVGNKPQKVRGDTTGSASQKQRRLERQQKQKDKKKKKSGRGGGGTWKDKLKGRFTASGDL